LARDAGGQQRAERQPGDAAVERGGGEADVCRGLACGPTDREVLVAELEELATEVGEGAALHQPRRVVDAAAPAVQGERAGAADQRRLPLESEQRAAEPEPL